MADRVAVPLLILADYDSMEATRSSPRKLALVHFGLRMFAQARDM